MHPAADTIALARAGVAAVRDDQAVRRGLGGTLRIAMGSRGGG